MALTLYTNTYIASLAAAQAIFDERLGATAWINAGDTERTQALIMAFRKLEAIKCWQGVPTTMTQSANWPRSYVPEPGSMVNAEVVINVNYGATVPVYLDGATVPTFITQAQAEEALAILDHEGYTTSATPASNPRALLQAQGVRNVSIDGVSESYSGNGAVTYGGNARLFSSDAWALIRPYLVLYGQLSSDPAKLEA